MSEDLESEADVLRRIPLFAGVPASKLKLLAFTCDVLRFRTGDRLFAQGDFGDAAYVILSGAVDVYVSAGGASIKVATLGANEVVGDMAILSDAPRSAAAFAASPLETLKIDQRAFFELIETSPNIAIEMLRVLARRLTITTRELSEARAAQSVGG